MPEKESLIVCVCSRLLSDRERVLHAHKAAHTAVPPCSGYAGFVDETGSVVTPYKVSPRKAEMMFLATSVATRTCASTVDAPRCGVAITRSCASNCLKTVSSPIGSWLKTSSATPASRAFSERSQQRLLVDQAASCAVHQIGTRFEQAQFTGAKQSARAALVIGEGGMQRHEICPLQHLFFAVQCHPDLLPLFGRDKGITGDDPHAECLRPLCHLFADLSQADDAEHLAVELDAQQAALVPPARFDTAVGGGNVSCQREQQRHGMFGDRNRIASGSMHHQHSVPDRGIQIDVVQARPGPPDDL